MKGGYNFGEWSKNPEVTRRWSKADYFLNNREIRYSPRIMFPIIEVCSKKHTSIILTLYALIDLTERKDKTYFQQKDVYDMIKKNITLYKMKLTKKGKEVVKRRIMSKWERSNRSFDYTKKLQKEEQQVTQFFMNFRGISMDDLYYAIATLVPVFVWIKNYQAKENYNDSDFEPSTKVKTYYHLNDDGKELMRKVKENNYLL